MNTFTKSWYLRGLNNSKLRNILENLQFNVESGLFYKDCNNFYLKYRIGWAFPSITVKETERMQDCDIDTDDMDQFVSDYQAAKKLQAEIVDALLGDDYE